MKSQNHKGNLFDSTQVLTLYNCYFCVFSWISFSLALLSYVNIKNILNLDQRMQFPHVYNDWESFPISSVDIISEGNDCPAGTLSLIQFPSRRIEPGCQCKQENYGYPCTATMIQSGCTITEVNEQTLNKWPFDDIINELKGYTLCGKQMAQSFGNYTCNATYTKQCGQNLCVGENEPCPLKEITFSQGGLGKVINNKWNLIEIPMSGNSDPSFPFLKFEVVECDQCFPLGIQREQFYEVNGLKNEESNSQLTLRSKYFTRKEKFCPILDLNDDLWEVEKIQLFACVSCGAFAGLFGGLILLVTTCSFIGCDIECLMLGKKHPIYAGIIKLWVFTKFFGEVVALIAIICSFITQTNFLSSIWMFLESSCTEQFKIDELEEFIRQYKKFVYYFTMVDLILYMGTISLDIIFSYTIWMSKNETEIPIPTPKGDEQKFIKNAKQMDEQDCPQMSREQNNSASPFMVDKSVQYIDINPDNDEKIQKVNS